MTQLVSFFYKWLTNFPSTTCWRGYLFSIVSPQPLLSKVTTKEWIYPISLSSQLILPKIWERKYIIRNFLFIVQFRLLRGKHCISLQMSVFLVSVFCHIFCPFLQSDLNNHLPSPWEENTLNPLLQTCKYADLKKTFICSCWALYNTVSLVSLVNSLRLVCCFYFLSILEFPT